MQYQGRQPGVEFESSPGHACSTAVQVPCGRNRTLQPPPPRDVRCAAHGVCRCLPIQPPAATLCAFPRLARLPPACWRSCPPLACPPPAAAHRSRCRRALKLAPPSPTMPRCSMALAGLLVVLAAGAAGRRGSEGAWGAAAPAVLTALLACAAPVLPSYRVLRPWPRPSAPWDYSPALLPHPPPAAARPAPTPAAAAGCTDRPPPSYSCAQQHTWGKCGEAWMAPYCARTCGRCGGGDARPAVARPAAPAPPASPAPPATPATPATATAQLDALPGSVSEYGKVH